MLKIMFSTGEASGDLHAANVAKVLKTIQPDIQMFGMGGKAMQAAGVEILYDIADLGVIGLVEVIKNLPRLFKLRDYLHEILKSRRPDVLVVVDYPGFNLRLAAKAKELGIPVVYYISPQVWAWGRGRARNIAKTIDRIAAIFPFEAEVYQTAGANVSFVGHPLLDIVKPSMTKEEAYHYFGADKDKPLIMLMPGSRKQEIENLLPLMLEAAVTIDKQIKGCQFYIPVASTISREMLLEFVNKYDLTINLSNEYTYDLMNIADLAIAASGTATLETTLMKLPTIIIYKVAALTYILGKHLVKIPHVGLPNIIAGREIVPELIQGQANSQNISERAIGLLTNEKILERTLEDLSEMRQKLGGSGAVQRAAQVILDVAGKQAGGKR